MQVPKLQKRLLLQEFPAPAQLLIDFVTFCIISATYVLLHVGSQMSMSMCKQTFKCPLNTYTRLAAAAPCSLLPFYAVLQLLVCVATFGVCPPES